MSPGAATSRSLDGRSNTVDSILYGAQPRSSYARSISPGDLEVPDLSRYEGSQWYTVIADISERELGHTAHHNVRRIGEGTISDELLVIVDKLVERDDPGEVSYVVWYAYEEETEASSAEVRRYTDSFTDDSRVDIKTEIGSILVASDALILDDTVAESLID